MWSSSKPQIMAKREILLPAKVSFANLVGFARNFLIPKQYAYYVPRYRGKPILPQDWKPAVKTRQNFKITPAFAVKDYQEINQLNLEQLSKVQLELRRSRLTETEFYGSVTSRDISEELGKLGFRVAHDQIVFNKTNKFGEHGFNINKILLKLKITA
jgi:ribosomal protein L9